MHEATAAVHVAAMHNGIKAHRFQENREWEPRGLQWLAAPSSGLNLPVHQSTSPPVCQDHC
jgi:hypothetical protein